LIRFLVFRAPPLPRYFFGALYDVQLQTASTMARKGAGVFRDDGGLPCSNRMMIVLQ
jgi:hypothetical protein